MFELKTEIPRDRAQAKIVQLGQLTSDPVAQGMAGGLIGLAIGLASAADAQDLGDPRIFFGVDLFAAGHPLA